MIETIKRRTAVGQFGNRSSGARARRYADGSQPVTLRETGSMMEALRGKVYYNTKAIRAEVEVEGGRNSRLAKIHNTTGTPAGRGRSQRIRRQFIFLNEGEWDQVVLNAMRQAGLRRGERGRRGDRFN